MPRFDRSTYMSEHERQKQLDEAYTLLHFTKSALERAKDYDAARAVGEIADKYRLKGATLRYEYAPR